MEIPNNLDCFRKELERKGYRKNSIENYMSYCSVFLKAFKERECPKHVSEQDIKDFLRGFTEHNTQRAYHSAIKAFYKYVVKQPNKFKWVEYAKRSRELPIVLSVEEVKAMVRFIFMYPFCRPPFCLRPFYLRYLLMNAKR